MTQNMTDSLNAKLPTEADQADFIKGAKIQGGTKLEKQTQKILAEIAVHKTVTPTQMSVIFGMSRQHVSTHILKPLVKQGVLAHVAGTKGQYKKADDKVTTQASQETDRINAATIFQDSKNMAEWQSNGKAKHEKTFLRRFTRIVTGQINPNYKIHPDKITRDNWQEHIKVMVAAIKQATGRDSLAGHDRSAIRNFLAKALDVSPALSVGKKLGIDNPNTEPKQANVRLTNEQFEKVKDIIRKIGKTEFAMFGFQLWTFTRPSAVYTMPISAFEFKDRTTERVHVGGEIEKSTEVIKFAKLILATNPNLKDSIKFTTETKRACYVRVYEWKQKKHYNRYVFDSDYVIPLEKYINTRRTQGKKYAFWDDNSTEFTMKNYTDYTKSKLNARAKVLKKVFAEVGITAEQMNVESTRPNYLPRHIGLQMWLEMTNYDYYKIGTMSHEDVNTLKKWYGEKSTERMAKDFENI